MTNDDAIKWLENLKQDIGQLRHENLWPYAQAIDEICGLLEEQEAVKPIEPIYQGDDSYVCENCGETVGWEEIECYGIGKIRYKYCPGCGRAVKWE